MGMGYSCENTKHYLCNSSLHNQEMRVVDIELDGPEEVLHPVVLDIAPVDEVLVLPPNDDLPGDGDLVEVLITQGRLFLVPVVESY